MAVLIYSADPICYSLVSADAGEFKVFTNGTIYRLNEATGGWRKIDMTDFTEAEAEVIRNAGLTSLEEMKCK